MVHQDNSSVVGEQIIVLQYEQQGFMRNRSCTDPISIIRQICEKALEFNKPAYFCLVDIEKAFDQLQVIHVLNQINVPNGK